MFRAALGVRDFRRLWLAEALSQAGDQLARVALAVLVFQRTDSALLTALTYALSFVPTLVGGALLGGLADRYPRRLVMVGCDLVRAVLVGVMAVPGLELPVLYVLVALMTLLGGPFRAAQQALLPEVLDGERYVQGLALRGMTIQSAQLAGFAGGGALVAALTPYWALALDAGTFLVSGLVITFGVDPRPAPVTAADRPGFGAAIGDGVRLLWRAPGLRALAVLSWLAGFYVVPEGLAAPYAGLIGAGTIGIGLFMAGDPAGSVLGAYALARWVPERLRPKVIGPLALLTGLPLLVFALRPGLVVGVLALGLSGAAAQAYQTQATASLARAVPDAGRAQAMGLVVTGLVTAQGLGVLAAGALAGLVGADLAIALAGAAGIGVGIPAALAWRRAGYG
ncbi:MFS transporter [Kutzneria viridogrisea]|uniref:MFS family arabinose efflux permease n=1 Tax=Kutzneria viridogrisea TaxID=47990 RepID=A0ABR6BED5_9PSEU|nr:putative MFS family arabinose efflux permease [Kutzneria viridogrisea]